MVDNHPDLRAELEASGAVPDGGWRGHSDTEVLLQGIATWGLKEALRRLGEGVIRDRLARP